MMDIRAVSYEGQILVRVGDRFFQLGAPDARQLWEALNTVLSEVERQELEKDMQRCGYHPQKQAG